MAKWAFLIFLILLVGCQSRENFQGTVMTDPQPAPDFLLQDQFGNPFRLSDVRGKVVVLFFGYTWCPDVCPATLATWRQVWEKLPQGKDDVKFVYVTVDPERDTPERLRDHLQVFNEKFIGLTGSREQLEKVYQDYHVFVDKNIDPQNPDRYTVAHTSRIFVIDHQGILRLSFSFGTPAETIVHDLNILLSEIQ